MASCFFLFLFSQICLVLHATRRDSISSSPSPWIHLRVSDRLTHPFLLDAWPLRLASRTTFREGRGYPEERVLFHSLMFLRSRRGKFSMREQVDGVCGIAKRVLRQTDVCLSRWPQRRMNGALRRTTQYALMMRYLEMLWIQWNRKFHRECVKWAALAFGLIH